MVVVASGFLCSGAFYPSESKVRALRFAQNPDDLLCREPARLHGPSPIRGDELYPFLEEFAGLRSRLVAQ